MKKFKYLFFCLILSQVSYAQMLIYEDEIKPGRFDQGKMWTFENPPLDYFKEAYNFTPDEAWLEDVRKSALRFSSWCSASFISEDGLIMTNHHCSRSVTASVMKENEDFESNGFYAESLADERKVPNLYVDQLVKIADITEQVKNSTAESEGAALKKILENYKVMPSWKDLELETRTFYSGGKYSLYGFKRYSDIRLVLYPELALGYYGGDPDNFTYPRYNLDFTFFRAYDKAGNPLKTPFYYPFNADGIKEGTPVFVIGNPGSTGRYLTMSQLLYRRDVRAPVVISFLQDRVEILGDYAKTIDNIYKKDSVINVAFSYRNGNKAYTGRLQGLNDEYLMAKKRLKEEDLRSNLSVEGSDPWKEIKEFTAVQRASFPETFLLAPSASRGKMNALSHELFKLLKNKEKEDVEAASKNKSAIEEILSGFEKQLEIALFAALIDELKQYSSKEYVNEIINGENPVSKAKSIIENSDLFNDKKRNKLLDKDFKKLDKSDDPMLKLAKTLVPEYMDASIKMGKATQANKVAKEKIISMQFALEGLKSPPDASLSLRIADGKVKRYDYNGTIAPYKTTYFGLYDRHFSNDQEEPWHLPDRWKNPSPDLLKSPLNFVCTADIIGGNSGSPVINKEKEVVGLVFDGNIESLPGFFIFDDTYNRTVAVHAGGISAALKYVYNANRLLNELNLD